MSPDHQNSIQAEAYCKDRTAHWDRIAVQMDRWKGAGGYYHRRLSEIYQFLAAPGQRVLEIGCAQGDLLASVKPSYGVGIDFSEEMIQRARQRHPELHFVLTDAHNFELTEKFDIIIISDLLNDVWDVQTVLDQVRRVSTRRTRVIVNSYSRLWEPLLALAEKIGVAKPTLYQNWLTSEDIANLLNLSGFDTIRSWPEIMWPFRFPLLDAFFNRLVVKLWPFKELGLTNMLVARPQAQTGGNSVDGSIDRGDVVVSVIVPARNEAGNIAQIMERVPEMGKSTELIFVEGHSRDKTYEAIEEAIANHPERNCKLFRQTGVGKGDAVRVGFNQVSGDILMILDADLTVPPEDLPRFFEVLCSGKGDFANGVRLVYPMEKEAMRFFNLLGNKFFSLAFSWLLGQSVKDTLCGTKVLWRQDYERISANRAYFGDFDPFGDFDLLFGASKLTLKIVDLPIRYRERTYGTTNIQRWKHGWLLLKMVSFAASRIKFV
jgi:ubiquinone/menaquinone biosynthesis C-methylase UbiE